MYLISTPKVTFDAKIFFTFVLETASHFLPQIVLVFRSTFDAKTKQNKNMRSVSKTLVKTN